MKNRPAILYNLKNSCCFADSMEEQFTIYIGIQDAGHTAAIEDFLCGYFSDIPLPFDRVGIDSAVCWLHPNRAPSEKCPGHFQSGSLQNALPFLLLLACLIAVSSCVISSAYGRVLNTMVLKPQKLHTVPENYHPTSLLPVTLKVFERLAPPHNSPAEYDYLTGAVWVLQGALYRLPHGPKLQKCHPHSSTNTSTWAAQM